MSVSAIRTTGPQGIPDDPSGAAALAADAPEAAATPPSGTAALADARADAARVQSQLDKPAPSAEQREQAKTDKQIAKLEKRAGDFEEQAEVLEASSPERAAQLRADAASLRDEASALRDDGPEPTLARRDDEAQPGERKLETLSRDGAGTGPAPAAGADRGVLGAPGGGAGGLEPTGVADRTDLQIIALADPRVLRLAELPAKEKVDVLRQLAKQGASPAARATVMGEAFRTTTDPKALSELVAGLGKDPGRDGDVVAFLEKNPDVAARIASEASGAAQGALAVGIANGEGDGVSRKQALQSLLETTPRFAEVSAALARSPQGAAALATIAATDETVGSRMLSGAPRDAKVAVGAAALTAEGIPDAARLETVNMLADTSARPPIELDEMVRAGGEPARAALAARVVASPDEWGGLLAAAGSDVLKGSLAQMIQAGDAGGGVDEQAEALGRVVQSMTGPGRDAFVSKVSRSSTEFREFLALASQTDIGRTLLPGLGPKTLAAVTRGLQRLQVDVENDETPVSWARIGRSSSTSTSDTTSLQNASARGSSAEVSAKVEGSNPFGFLKGEVATKGGISRTDTRTDGKVQTDGQSSSLNENQLDEKEQKVRNQERGKRVDQAVEASIAFAGTKGERFDAAFQKELDRFGDTREQAKRGR